MSPYTDILLSDMLYYLSDETKSAALSTIFVGLNMGGGYVPPRIVLIQIQILFNLMPLVILNTFSFDLVIEYSWATA